MSDGKWRVALWLAPGKYHYKFVVDGQWLCDLGKPTVTDEEGNLNNVIEVVGMFWETFPF